MRILCIQCNGTYYTIQQIMETRNKIGRLQVYLNAIEYCMFSMLGYANVDLRSLSQEGVYRGMTSKR